MLKLDDDGWGCSNAGQVPCCSVHSRGWQGQPRRKASSDGTHISATYTEWLHKHGREEQARGRHQSTARWQKYHSLVPPPFDGLHSLAITYCCWFSCWKELNDDCWCAPRGELPPIVLQPFVLSQSALGTSSSSSPCCNSSRSLAHYNPMMNEFKSHYLQYAPLMCIVNVMLKFNQIIMETVIDYCYSFAPLPRDDKQGWLFPRIAITYRRHHHRTQ